MKGFNIIDFDNTVSYPEAICISPAIIEMPSLFRRNIYGLKHII